MQIILHNSEFVNLIFSDGILYVTFKKGPINLEIAKELVKKRLEFSKNKKFPILITDNGKRISNLDREAREYFGKGKATEGISASAFFTESILNKYIINFFLKISTKKTFFPIKIFSDKQEAINWLKQYT